MNILQKILEKDVFEAQMGKSLVNMCQAGKSLPIWEKDMITETFCRCPDGSYGITCMVMILFNQIKL